MQWAAANANVAVVKYWGKAPGDDNVAAGGSLSVTLDGLTTIAGVEFSTNLNRDELPEMPAGARERISRFLDEARRALGVEAPARVAIESNFPVAAGLASSASIFAALARAVVAAAEEAVPRSKPNASPANGAAPTGGTDADFAVVESLARRGSGSACRSLLPGYVEWTRPEDGGRVVPVAPADHWPLAIVIAVTRREPKSVGSREGMRRTMATSPYYPAWLSTNAADLDAARRAIRERDLELLGSTAERNCFRMHAAALASDPPLLYWAPATLAVVHEVRRLRDDGVPAWLTIDAGPQVKVLCEPRDADAVEVRLRAVDGVLDVVRSRPGPGARLLDAPPDGLVEGIREANAS